MAAVKLSIIIPAYNEGHILQKNLDLMLNSFPKAEIILSDDGSTDNTEQIVQKFLKKIRYIKTTKNKGKGYAIKRGMLEADGDYIIFADADLPFGIEGINKIIEELSIKKRQIVITEKIKYQKGVIYFFVRDVVSKIISLIFNFSFNDTQAGLKGFSAEAKESIFPNTFINRFACDIEILFLAKRCGLTVTSVPLEIRSDPKRLSSFKFKQGLIFMIDVLKIRFHRYKNANIPLCKNSKKI